MKLKLIFILIILLTGCRSKKVVTEEFNQKEDNSSTRIEKVVDTIYKDRIIEKIKPIFSEVIIEKPCDSLGNLNPIFYNIGSGANRSSVYSRDGKLYIEQKIDSVENRLEKDYRTRWKQDSLDLRKEFSSTASTSEVIVKYVYPWWWWLLLIAGALVIILRIFEKFSIIGRVKKILSS